jgi:hypothetical protein
VDLVLTNNFDGIDLDYNGCKVRSNSRGYKFEDCFDNFNVRTIEL